MSKRISTRTVTLGAMSVALAYVLGLIKLFHMPAGGSVTPAAMLPLILYAFTCGPAAGALAGAAFGLLKLTMGGEVYHLLQVVLDYPLAYAAMAACVLGKRLPSQKLRLPTGVLLGYLARWVCATLSGAVFFAEYATGNPWLYSMGYNAAYLGAECAFALLLAFIPAIQRLPDRLTR